MIGQYSLLSADDLYIFNEGTITVCMTNSAPTSARFRELTGHTLPSGPECPICFRDRRNSTAGTREQCRFPSKGGRDLGRLRSRTWEGTLYQISCRVPLRALWRGKGRSFCFCR